MNELEEAAYLAGQRAAWATILGHAVKELGYKESRTAWIAEREAALAQLRILCAEFGDNDWDEHLHLADIIGKHLGTWVSMPSRQEQGR